MKIGREFAQTISSRLFRVAPFKRRLLLIAVDAVLLSTAVWLSFWLRLAHPFHPSFIAVGFWLLPVVWLVGLPLYAFSGQYKGLTRYVGSRALYQLALRNGLLVMILLCIGSLFQLAMPPRSSWILLWMLLTCFAGASRFGLRDVLWSLQSEPRKARTRVAIYGAGAAGVQLAAALRLAHTHSVELFVDDDPALWDRSINGVSIAPPQVLQQRDERVDQVLLAIPSLSRPRRRQILEVLQQRGIPVLQIPSMKEITSGCARIDALRPIQVEELLGRDPVPPDPTLLGPGITGASVCVTGAGGSIGSELCRQILSLKPKRLVLLERSEPSLYSIHQELSSELAVDVVLLPVLGSAADAGLVERCFKENCVEVVFHAAAYKHVPLVESNPLAGLSNNVVSTRVVCEAARRCGSRKLVLISTDKAVRPTNVMGASKRLAELVVQSQPPGSTCFAMVRFGNVLGSSGSVLPLFRRQIEEGGPVTLTHPEIIRYFMTIPEAALLVLQASVLAESGDLLILEMGDPVRIKDLAEQMVRLSGRTLRDSSNPGGDIEILCTGLRPGEKLYEELLIDADCRPTRHSQIYRARERSLSPQILLPQLEALEKSIAVQDEDAALKILGCLVPEWQRQG